MRRLLIVVSLALAASTPARAEGEISYRVPGKRPLQNKLVIGGVTAAGVIAGGIGLLYHLDSRDAAAEVSADDGMPVGTWTPDRQATYDRAESSGIKATLGYSMSATLLVGAAVFAYLTRPPDEVVVLRPALAPTRGGAVVGAEVRW